MKNYLKLFSFLMMATALSLSVSSCKDDNTSNDEEVEAFTPAKSVSGIWKDDVQKLELPNNTLTQYITFNSDGKSGEYLTFQDGRYTGVPISYNYNATDGFGTYKLGSEDSPEYVFAAGDDFVVMQFSNDSIGILSKTSYTNTDELIACHTDSTLYTSLVEDEMGPDQFYSDLVLDLSDVSAKTRADKDDEGGFPKWLGSVLGPIGNFVMGKVQNAIVDEYLSQSEDGGFAWFTESRKIAAIYKKLDGIDKKLDKFAQSEISRNNTNTYTNIRKDLTKWTTSSLSVTDALAKLPEITDSIERVKAFAEIIRPWGKDRFAEDFCTYLTNLNLGEFVYQKQLNTGTADKSVDMFRFFALWGYDHYCWNDQMYDFFLASSSGFLSTITSCSLYALAYYTYCEDKPSMCDLIATEYGKFIDLYEKYEKELKPSENEVECLIPNCHIKLKRKMYLQDYSKHVLENDKPVTVTDIFCHDDAPHTGGVGAVDYFRKASAISWTIALYPSYTHDNDKTINDKMSGILKGEESQKILKAYEGTEYAGNLGKILLKTSGMTFDNSAKIDTADIKFYVETYYQRGNLIPLILDKDNNYLMSYIKNDVGNIETYGFYIHGHSYADGSEKFYKVGVLDVTENTKKFLWFFDETESYTINGIKDVVTPYWLYPTVTKRSIGAAGWE